MASLTATVYSSGEMALYNNDFFGTSLDTLILPHAASTEGQGHADDPGVSRHGLADLSRYNRSPNHDPFSSYFSQFNSDADMNRPQPFQNHLPMSQYGREGEGHAHDLGKQGEEMQGEFTSENTVYFVEKPESGIMDSVDDYMDYI